MEHAEPNYFAVIPTKILFHDGLIPKAILLYGAITCLTHEKGYCWAKDSYFATRFKVSKTTVQNWLKSLEDFGLIRREVVYKEGSKEILHRYIRIIEKPTQESLRTPTQENLRDNNKSFSNKVNNKEDIKTSASEQKDNGIPFAKILDYLNQEANRKFRNMENNRKFIRARWNEGYRFDDFQIVIDNMVANWTGVIFSDGTHAETYLQPSTLFGTGFDKYLNQIPRNKQKTEVDYSIPENMKKSSDDGPTYSDDDLPF